MLYTKKLRADCARFATCGVTAAFDGASAVFYASQGMLNVAKKNSEFFLFAVRLTGQSAKCAARDLFGARRQDSPERE